jgi:hypothetical protein
VRGTLRGRGAATQRERGVWHAVLGTGAKASLRRRPPSLPRQAALHTHGRLAWVPTCAVSSSAAHPSPSTMLRRKGSRYGLSTYRGKCRGSRTGEGGCWVMAAQVPPDKQPAGARRGRAAPRPPGCRRHSRPQNPL